MDPAWPEVAAGTEPAATIIEPQMNEGRTRVEQVEVEDSDADEDGEMAADAPLQDDATHREGPEGRGLTRAPPQTEHHRGADRSARVDTGWNAGGNAGR